MEREINIKKSRYFISDDGKIYSEHKGTRYELSLFMKGRYVKMGGVRRKVAQVIAETFVPNYRRLPYVVHLNGDKSDNRAENLRWSEEEERITGHGRRRVARVSDDGGVVQFESVTEAARKSGVYKYGILEVLRGRRKDYAGYRWYELKKR